MKIEIEEVPAGDLELKLLLTNAINTQNKFFLKCEAFIVALVLFALHWVINCLIQKCWRNHTVDQNPSKTLHSTRTVKFFLNR